MKKFYFGSILLVLFLFSSALLAQNPKYSRVKIYTDEKGLKTLSAAGVTIDHGEYKKGTWFISDFSDSELSTIRSKGFRVEILIDDVTNHYIQQNLQRIHNTPNSVQNAICSPLPYMPVPSGFHYGSMAGFMTFNEIIANLDTLATLYPSLIKAKTSIDTSHSIEGRPLYWTRISNNPNVNQNKPQILYTALHHAREPASASQMIYYMYYLCENYNTDPAVKYLVDNTEMYFLPCVNPDGYVYNQTTNPGGGGMWRKNRRNNGDGTWGVDLNRNYGFDFAYDNIGSSPITSDDTYRGTAAFSEPETHAVMVFDTAHHFRIGVNYHTYGNDLIYPWGYGQGIYTPDSASFVTFANFMTEQNHFAFGTGDQTVGYVTNGDSDDWSYGEQTIKPKILSMTPEIGSSAEGFWPPQSSILGICRDALVQNLNAAWCITKFALAKDASPYYVGQTNGYFNYQVQRLGLDSPATYTVSILPITSNITSIGSSHSYPALSHLQTVTDSISYTLNPSITPGSLIKYLITVNNGTYTRSDTITKMFGVPAVAFASNGNSMTGWTSTTWGLSNSIYYSPTASITDSPGGNYPDNADEIITTTTPINLAGAVSARLNFMTRWATESGYDYTEVQVSNDGGNTWTPQCGKYTTGGNANQDPGKPLYNGFQLNWVKEDISLDDYLGQSILIRFELVSDAAVNYDGYYFDDLVVKQIGGAAGIEEHESSGLNLSQNMPNPSQNYTYINYIIGNGEQGVLKVYDTFGQLIKEEKVPGTSGNIRLTTESFSSGIYYYRIEAGNASSLPKKMTVTH